MPNTPILYSSKNCPFCLRTRVALLHTKQKVILRNVDFNNLPAEALAVSSHATVPSLVFSDDEYWDESWEIVKWATQQRDPDNWLGEDGEYLNDAEMLVEINDHSFTEDLKHYKKRDNDAEHPVEYYRQRGEEFLEELNDMLEENDFLLASHMTIADITVFPFVRAFAMVDKDWFDKTPYPKLQKWLGGLLDTDWFREAMKDHEIWQPGSDDIYL